MFRFLIGSEAGAPDSFSVPFPGREVSLSKPKQFFVLSPSHIAVPSYRATTAAIDRTIPFIAPAPVTFPVPSFTRASIATFVNSQGLIEIAPADTPRFEYDPVTLAPKGLLLEEARTNAITRSNDFTLWSRNRTTVTNTTAFPIFASGGVFLFTGDGTSNFKSVARGLTSSSTTRIMSVYLRRNTNNFAKIMTTGGDTTTFASFDLLTGAVGSRGAGATAATIIPWRDGWYRCTLTTSVSAANVMNVLLVSSATATRAETNTLATSIYIAGAQMEEGSFATSYIPTGAAVVTRAPDDFEEVLTPFPSTSDALGIGITSSHIGHPLSGAECAAMSRLNIEGPARLRDWGAELVFTS